MLTRLCEKFHEAEAEVAHGAVVLIDRPDLQAVLTAFSLMPAPTYLVSEGSIEHAILLDPDNGPADLDAPDLWDLMWRPASLNLTDLARRSGFTGREEALKKIIHQLRGARLIYPDGTISGTAKDILDAITVREIEKATGRRQEGGGEG